MLRWDIRTIVENKVLFHRVESLVLAAFRIVVKVEAGSLMVIFVSVDH